MTPDHRPTITPRTHNYAAKPCPRCYMPMQPGAKEPGRQHWACDNCGQTLAIKTRR